VPTAIATADVPADLQRDPWVEVAGCLDGIEERLVELERRPRDQGLLNDIHRALTALRGGIARLASESLQRSCQALEILFDRLRRGTRSLDGALLDAVVANVAMLHVQVVAQAAGHTLPEPDPRLLASLGVDLPEPSAAAAVDVATPAVPVTALSPVVAAEPEPEPRHAVAGGRRSVDHPGSRSAIGRRAGERSAVPLLPVEAGRLTALRQLGAALWADRTHLAEMRVQLIAGGAPAGLAQAIGEALQPIEARLARLHVAALQAGRRPLATVFDRLPRLVRDLARQGGKPVEFVCSGGAIELELPLIDALAEVLSALLRHAVANALPATTLHLAAGMAGGKLRIVLQAPGVTEPPSVSEAQAALLERQGAQLTSTFDVETGLTAAVALPLTAATLPVLCAAVGGRRVAWSLEQVGAVLPLPAGQGADTGLGQIDVAGVSRPLYGLAERLGLATTGAPAYAVCLDAPLPCALAVDALPERSSVCPFAEAGPVPASVTARALLADGRMVWLLDHAELMSGRTES